MAPWPVFVLAGVCIGLLAGHPSRRPSCRSSACRRCSPSPPASIHHPFRAGCAAPYVRRREARTRAAGWSLLGGMPAAVAGALLSHVIGGSPLLLASGAVLVIVGWRVLRPIEEAQRSAGIARRQTRLLLVATSAVVGLFAGLLANGGGSLLVRVYLLLFGLNMRESAGTSLLVISVLTIPTLATHWALGHVDWTVAGAFALGTIPRARSAVGSPTGSHARVSATASAGS